MHGIGKDIGYITEKLKFFAFSLCFHTSFTMSFTFNNFVSAAGLVTHAWQQEAFDFCINNEQAITPYLGIKGGLIADEMGLGKTIVAYLYALASTLCS